MSRAILHYLDREWPVIGETMDPSTQPRILIADDVPPICKVLARFLDRLGTVTVAEGGRESYVVCLEAIRELTAKDPPDVLVVDGLEGYGAQVAQLAISEGVPVVAYTSRPETFRRLGVPVVLKPDTGGLVAAVRVILSRADV